MFDPRAPPAHAHPSTERLKLPLRAPCLHLVPTCHRVPSIAPIFIPACLPAPTHGCTTPLAWRAMPPTHQQSRASERCNLHTVVRLQAVAAGGGRRERSPSSACMRICDHCPVPPAVPVGWMAEQLAAIGLPPRAPRRERWHLPPPPLGAGAGKRLRACMAPIPLPPRCGGHSADSDRMHASSRHHPPSLARGGRKPRPLAQQTQQTRRRVPGIWGLSCARHRSPCALPRSPSLLPSRPASAAGPPHACSPLAGPPPAPLRHAAGDHPAGFAGPGGRCRSGRVRAAGRGCGRGGGTATLPPRAPASPAPACNPGSDVR